MRMATSLVGLLVSVLVTKTVMMLVQMKELQRAHLKVVPMER